MIKKLVQNKRNILTYLITLIVSGAKLMTGTSPFGIAAFGAAATNKVPVLIPFIGITTITLLIFGPMAMLKFIISAVLFVAFKAFLKNDEENKMSEAIKMLVAVAISESIGLFMSKTLVYDSLLSIYSAITSAIFYLIFASGISTIVDYGRKKAISSEDMIASCVLLTVAITLLGETSIFGVSIRGVLSVLMVMLLGWKCGPCIGATAGIATSLVLGIMGYGSAVTVATYGFSGLLSGVFAKFGKVGAGIGFILGNIVLAFYANGSTEVIINLKEIIVASVCLFFIPKSFTVFIDDLFDYDGSLSNREIKYFEKNTIYRLGAMSEAMDNMAGEEALEQENSSEEMRIFIKSLNENSCKKCEHYSKCWEQNYHSMYETVFNAIETLQTEGEATAENIPENVVCKNREMLADGLNFAYQIYKVNQDWQQKMQEKRRQSYKQLKEMSSAIKDIKEEMKVVTSTTEKAKKENYKLSIGIAKCKKNDSVVSGDSFINEKIASGKYLLGISDGMGSGEKASKKSKKVISTLENLLKTGFEKQKAVDMINSVLIADGEEEIFATLDASVIDLESGSTEFIKVSSCPTYIKKGNNVDMIQSVGLPVGVLENIDIDFYGKSLETGDIVVMISDGIIDANQDYEPKELWVTELLKAVKTDNPQRLADIILQEAIDSNMGIAKDDMTVLVAVVQQKNT